MSADAPHVYETDTTHVVFDVPGPVPVPTGVPVTNPVPVPVPVPSPYDYWQARLGEMAAVHKAASFSYFKFDTALSGVYVVLVALSPSAYVLSTGQNPALQAQLSSYSLLLVGALAAAMKHFGFSNLQHKHYSLYSRCNRLLRELEVQEEFPEGDAKTFVKYAMSEINEIEAAMPENANASAS